MKPVSAHVEVFACGSYPLAPAQASSRCYPRVCYFGIADIGCSLRVLLRCLANSQKKLVHLQGIANRSYFCLAVLVCGCGWSDFDCVSRFQHQRQRSKRVGGMATVDNSVLNSLSSLNALAGKISPQSNSNSAGDSSSNSSNGGKQHTTNGK